MCVASVLFKIIPFVKPEVPNEQKETGGFLHPVLRQRTWIEFKFPSENIIGAQCKYGNARISIRMPKNA